MRDRFTNLDKQIAKAISEAEKGIQINQKDLIKEIKKRLDYIFSRYGKGGKLTMDEMRKYKRMRRLEAEIAKAVKDRRQEADKIIKSLLAESIHKSIETCVDRNTLKPTRVKAIKARIDVDKIINETVGGRNWLERTKRIEGNVAYDIISEVRAGIDQGISYHEMAAKIDKAMGKYAGRPETIARTETHRVIETSKNDAMVEVNKEIPQMKIWRNAGDEKVRSTHEAMEGQKVPFDEPFTLPSGAKAMYPGESGVAGEDINCRCFVEYVDATEDEIKEMNADENADNIVKNGDKEDDKKEPEKREYKIEKLGNALGYFKKEFQKILENCPNKDIQRFYDDYADDVASVERTKGFYSHSKKIVDIGKTLGADVPGYRHKFFVVAHEYGHFFDFNLKNPKLNFKEVDATNSIIDHTVLKKIQSSSDEFLAAFRKDKAAIKSIGLKKLCDDLIYKDASVCVQDAVDGIFLGEKDSRLCGHGDDYYNRDYRDLYSYAPYREEEKVLNDIKDKLIEMGIEGLDGATSKEYTRDYMTACETWASITSAITTNSEDELKYIKKYLPNSYEALIEIMKGMTK